MYNFTVCKQIFETTAMKRLQNDLLTSSMFHEKVHPVVIYYSLWGYENKIYTSRLEKYIMKGFLHIRRGVKIIR